jgi:integrase
VHIFGSIAVVSAGGFGVLARSGGRPIDPRRYVDTATRFQGVFARHSLNCALGIGEDDCNCKPSFYGSVWDPAISRHRKTEHRRLITEAKNLRDDLLAEVNAGIVVDEQSADLQFDTAHELFISDCKEGIALTKRGKPYKRKAIVNLDSSLKRLPTGVREKDLGAVTRGDLQEAVDDYLRPGTNRLSSSRVRAIINAVRSLYRWAEDREKVSANPAKLIRLPADDSVERDRVATPGEFAHLLERLDPQDAMPWALAAYATARSQEIRALEWPEVNFDSDVILLADDEEARKSEAARRIVPMVAPLRSRLHAEWIRQGRPQVGRVCPPRKYSPSGMISLDQLQKRIVSAWKKANLNPIGLQDSRHTAATWLDHAGVAPKVASVFMGHKAPRRGLHPDAAPITLGRYTHVLDGELERARDQLGRFLAEREAEERDHEFELRCG